jgi:hypothetical protein
MMLLPPIDAWLGFPGFLLAALLCILLGGAVCGRVEPEFRLIAGWGLLSIVLTLWGVLTPLSLRIPVLLLTALALASLALRGNRVGWPAIGRTALLTLPLWLAMVPLHAAEIDTWLNLLPNAAYLADHGVFPTAWRPESWSFLPGAPYNTQFVAFAGSVLSGGFSQAAMSWFNILLACAAGLLLARIIADTSATPPWWAFACGFLLAVPLNPGFTPRVSFAAYGEWPLGATLMAAIWLGAAYLQARRQGGPGRPHLIALALVLAAMVNTKQSGLGLVIALAAPLAALGLTIPGRRIATAVSLAVAVLPSLLLYAIWQIFVAHAGIAQLTVLPESAWNIPLLPQILRAMLHEVVLRATFFLLLAATLIAGAIAAGRRDLSPRGTVLMLFAATALLFNLYLLLTYVVHFDPGMAVRAHSYARYNFQLGLALMLALTVLLRPAAHRLVTAWSAATRRRAAIVAIMLVLLLPITAMPVLRFDFDVPQPTLRLIAAGTATHLAPGDRLGLILPNDQDDNVASFLRGTLLFTPPRRHPLDFRIADDNAQTTFTTMAQAGFPLILTSCTPSDLPGVPPNVAALLRRSNDTWQVLETWRYPPDLARARSGMLAPLCNPKR